MQKVFSLLLVLILSFSMFSFGVYANDSSEPEIIVEYYDDGTYSVTEIGCGVVTCAGTTQQVTNYKTRNVYDGNDNKLFSCSITGTFRYDGTTSTCTSANSSYQITDDAWKITSHSASRSGNTATGTFTAKKYFVGLPVGTKDISVSLSCSPTGVFS